MGIDFPRWWQRPLWWCQRVIMRRAKPGKVWVTDRDLIELLLAERRVTELEAESAALEANCVRRQSVLDARDVIEEVRARGGLPVGYAEDLLEVLPYDADGALHVTAFRALVIDRAMDPRFQTTTS